MPDVHECTHLEDWVRPSKSVMWSFNRSYWRHLAAWDETFQKDYAAALPGGVSDGTNPEFWADQIDAFMATAQPPRGVVGAARRDPRARARRRRRRSRRKVWLDAFAAACEEQRPRLPAPRALPDGRLLAARAGARRRARRRLRARWCAASSSTSATRCTALATCAASCSSPTPATSTTTSRPTRSCASATRLRAARPRQHHARRDGRAVRAARDRPRTRSSPSSSASCATGPSSLGDLAARRALLGRRVGRRPPRGDLRRDRGAGVAARRAERRRPPRRAGRRAAGVDARAHVDRRRGELRADPAAAAPRGHPRRAGPLRPRASASTRLYRGPGKLEGSIVNWLNGPIFQLVGERSGFEVDRRALRLPREARTRRS